MIWLIIPFTNYFTNVINIDYTFERIDGIADECKWRGEIVGGGLIGEDPLHLLNLKLLFSLLFIALRGTEVFYGIRDTEGQ